MFGTACIVSMQSMVCVHPSVCPNMDPQRQTCCCKFAAVGLAGMSYRLIAAAAAVGNVGSATLSAYVGS